MIRSIPACLPHSKVASSTNDQESLDRFSPSWNSSQKRSTQAWHFFEKALLFFRKIASSCERSAKNQVTSWLKYCVHATHRIIDFFSRTDFFELPATLHRVLKTRENWKIHIFEVNAFFGKARPTGRVGEFFVLCTELSIAIKNNASQLDKHARGQRPASKLEFFIRKMSPSKVSFFNKLN